MNDGKEKAGINIRDQRPKQKIALLILINRAISFHLFINLSSCVFCLSYSPIVFGCEIIASEGGNFSSFEDLVLQNLRLSQLFCHHSPLLDIAVN